MTKKDFNEKYINFKNTTVTVEEKINDIKKIKRLWRVFSQPFIFLNIPPYWQYTPTGYMMLSEVDYGQ